MPGTIGAAGVRQRKEDGFAPPARHAHMWRVRAVSRLEVAEGTRAEREDQPGAQERQLLPQPVAATVAVSGITCPSRGQVSAAGRFARKALAQRGEIEEVRIVEGGLVHAQPAAQGAARPIVEGAGGWVNALGQREGLSDDHDARAGAAVDLGQRNRGQSCAEPAAMDSPVQGAKRAVAVALVSQTM